MNIKVKYNNEVIDIQFNEENHWKNYKDTDN